MTTRYSRLDIPAEEPGESDVPFTQFLMPDGRTRKSWIRRTPEIGSVAHDLLSRGVRFEIEILQTRDVSMTAERDDADGEVEVLAHRICENGPELPGVVDELVIAARRALKGKD